MHKTAAFAIHHGLFGFWIYAIWSLFLNGHQLTCECYMARALHASKRELLHTSLPLIRLDLTPNLDNLTSNYTPTRYLTRISYRGPSFLCFDGLEVHLHATIASCWLVPWQKWTPERHGETKQPHFHYVIQTQLVGVVSDPRSRLLSQVSEVPMRCASTVINGMKKEHHKNRRVAMELEHVHDLYWSSYI